MKNQKNKIQVTEKKQTLIAHFEGPLPHPDILNRYGDVDKNIPRLIVDMAQKQTNSRIENEKLEQESIIKIRKAYVEQESKFNNRGQLYSFIIIMTLILGGIYLLNNDKNISGYVSLGIGVVGAISILVYKDKK